MKNNFFIQIMATLMMFASFSAAWSQQTKWGTSFTDLNIGSGTLNDAFWAAKQDSTVKYVQLQSDVSSTSSYYMISGGNFIFDLNGYMLDINMGLEIYGGATITIVDTSTEGSGAIVSGSMTGMAIRVKAANVRIEAGKIEGYRALLNEGEVTITGGYFRGATSGRDNGRTIENSGVLNISGGTFTGSIGHASTLYMTSASAYATITGGTFKEGYKGTVDYIGGVLDLTNYKTITEISIYNSNLTNLTPKIETIVLPVNYCLYDSETDAVTEIMPQTKCTIGMEPENQYILTYNANNNEEQEFSVSTYGKHQLAECTFSAPNDMIFKAWRVNNLEYQVGDIITVSTNTQIEAVWEKYVPKIVINMKDDYGDGWDGDKIIVKKDGKEILSTSVSEKTNTEIIEYDSTSEYSFSWQITSASGRCPDECSFNILLENKTVFTTTDCSDYTDGQILHTILAKPIEHVVINDRSLTDFVAEKNTKADTITYTRTLNNLYWNALYVPFEIPVSQLIEDYDIAYINAMHSYDMDDNGAIDKMEMEVVKIKEGTLHANYPYLIRAKNEEAKAMEIVVENSTLYAAESVTVDCSSVFTKFEITGTYQPLTNEEIDGCRALSDGTWKTMPEDATLNPFRLYLRISDREGSPVKVDTYALEQTSVTIRVQGENPGTTSIESEEIRVKNEESDATIYNLMGQPVKNPVKGHIYIQGGRKVVW